MIIVVDDRAAVTDAYAASFRREGISVSGFSAEDLQGWIAAAADDDVRAVDAFLIGECESQRYLAGIVRRRCSAAVIALKEQRSLDATLELFAGGVDDVVAKPIHVREILARIHAISRRARAEGANSSGTDEISIFCDGSDPLVRGERLALPRRELRILECLAASQPRRVTKTQIFNAVYGIFDHDIGENVIESHISKLRRRLRFRLGYDPIESQRHLGYRLVCRARE